uniref:Uncharacterized protein n=1 Tax=Magallana gigas TaxID=29159 RepID=K1PFL6_MAGGI
MALFHCGTNCGSHPPKFDGSVDKGPHQRSSLSGVGFPGGPRRSGHDHSAHQPEHRPAEATSKTAADFRVFSEDLE